jgi:hopene-associated glycosyltransferase HpnB
MESKLTVVRGAERPAGWKGKVWAMRQGVEASEAAGSEYVLLADADVVLQPGLLKALVAHAERERLDLASLMTLLRVESAWDRLLIPAFVYFFAKLYPFRWIGDPRKRMAGANGGCILLRRRALEDAGGLDAMQDAMIDDCALGRLVKGNGGRLWLGYTRDVRGRRAHGDLSTTWNMVARYAFAQLGYSYLLLLGVVLGMLLTYVVPPLGVALGATLLAPVGNVWAYTLLVAGAVSWLLMSATYVPMLRLYGLSYLYAPLLPIGAFMYTLMTVSSGVRYRQGRGGAWKGRTYDKVLG